jgi:peptidoglycan/LPS O-acetylase OafA/YrhL
MKTSPRFYHPELDGLRFIAFLLVFIHNAPSISSSRIWTLLHEYGWIGVDLFFCLSGFLITKLLITEHEQTGEINIRNFYVRRILRIAPLYLIYIALIFIFPTFFQRKYTDLETLQVAGLITFTFNFIYIYLFPFAIPFFVHLWTISYEGQFYLFTPWVIKKIRTVSPKKTTSILLTIFLIGTALRAIFIYSQFKHPAIYTLPFTRFEALLGGVAIALGTFDNSLHKIKTRALFVLGITLNALVFVLPKIYEINWDLMLSYLSVGIGLTLVLLSIIRQSNLIGKRLLSNPLLVYLGKISYGLYIFHLIGISIAFQVCESFLSVGIRNFDQQNALVFMLGLLITIAFSSIAYWLIEKPFLKLKDRFSKIPSRPI